MDKLATINIIDRRKDRKGRLICADYQLSTDCQITQCGQWFPTGVVVKYRSGGSSFHSNKTRKRKLDTENYADSVFLPRITNLLILDCV